MLLRLTSSLATVVRQAGRQAVRQTKIQVLAIFKQFYIRPPVSVLLYLMLYYILVLFHKSNFRGVKCL